MASRSLVLRQKGLRNLGQTCYLNVIVQILSCSKFIRQHVLSITLINADTDIKTTFQLFQDLIKDIQDPYDNRTTLTPSGFVGNITSKINGFKLHQQQCSLEFFDGLLLLLEKDLRQYRTENANNEVINCDNLIDDIFGGRTLCTTSCPKCSYVSAPPLDPFNSIQLGLEDVNSVNDALKKHCGIEELDDSQKWKCGYCNKIQRGLKKLQVSLE